MVVKEEMAGQAEGPVGNGEESALKQGSSCGGPLHEQRGAGEAEPGSARLTVKEDDKITPPNEARGEAVGETSGHSKWNSSIDAPPVRQTVAVRFMQGRRGVQEDRHVVVPDLRTLVDSDAKQEIESWEATPAALVALFDGHRGVACSDFCASTFSAKLADLLCRKLPEQIATKQTKPPSLDGTTQPSKELKESQGPPEDADAESSCLIPLSASSFTSPAPQEAPVDACCCKALKALLPSLPGGLQRLMPSLYHRIFSTFKQTDKEFISKYKKAPMTDASDSPSGLAPEEGTRGLVAVRITEDHKPNRPDEKARIEKAGGHVVVVGGVARVAPSDYEERTKRMKHEQCTIGGASQPPSTLLAVSRSFGDRDLKSEGLISATPEVILLPLSPELRFVVLACDGVWDALSDQEVVDIVSAHLHDPDEATSKVVKAAFDKGSQDNLTAMLVVFDTAERATTA